MTHNTPREQALAFIAAYEHGEQTAYERNIVRIARTWLKLMGSKQPVHGIVERLYLELTEQDTPDNGCAWSDLRRKFGDWAVASEWMDPAQLLSGSSVKR